ncbi:MULTISPECIES: UDP-N-acetylmuramate dehydrogenase [unclassified Paludibacterium]|uniref:UDP-N-acetylmuramate dehydrogenase n=1 Tax=unclassified Paludibacterium TaxID=2618429 RepID=UPI001C04F502|nr:UDP-N-acetylmuramate dehydrogenase [Paludibacterium sp. B53371]BEV70541.1 UDP-N-acetylmuramate dehydrogenase [Paludibacterium sp. THUN1379]
MSLSFTDNAPLKALNTFGMDVRARHFLRLSALEDLPALLASEPYRRGPVLWLGGGSNLLFTRDHPGLVVQVALSGRHELDSDDETVLVEAAAGENWHEWVQYTLQQGWYGLENLSLIPGSVGACPVQNIGAYGVEVRERIHEVVCADLQDGGRTVVLSNAECAFGYRDSLFKHQAAGRYLICAVRFRLSRRPQIRAAYGDIERELQQLASWPHPTPADVSQAVVSIRSAKLPNPLVLGNAGSFFKNPVVPEALADQLAAQYPRLPRYPAANGQCKLAAGWLIEQAGFKGYRQGDAGVHERQALVLVNHGSASGSEIRALAQRIQDEVEQRFGVRLEPEPVII